MSNTIRVALALAAVSALVGSGVASAKSLFSRPDAAVVRGHVVAQRECAGCHAIEKSGASLNPAAPPFRDIRVRYNETSLQREFEAIREVGHYEMPPKPIPLADGRDLIAYIESLGGR